MKKLVMFVAAIFALNVMADTEVVDGIEWSYIIENGEASVGVYSEVLSAISRSTHGDITIPSRLGSYPVAHIRKYAFAMCNFVTGVTIPSGVKDIGEGSFEFCESIKSITFPSSVSSIGAFSFKDCSLIQSVSIPSSVKAIGRCAFDGCLSLRFVHVAKGDLARVKKLLGDSGSKFGGTTGVDDLIFEEDLTSDNAKTGDTPIVAFLGEKATTLNGLVTNADGLMCGIMQVATAKAKAKGVKVSGFVMLEDGKKQTLKAATVPIENGQLNVATKVGKTSLTLTITGVGFTGTLGEMTVASGDVGEDTGIISGTLKMIYFDAKTGKIKAKSIKLTGITSNGEAVGGLTIKGQSAQSFAAEIQE